jgi:hypothetical protein
MDSGEACPTWWICLSPLNCRPRKG